MLGCYLRTCRVKMFFPGLSGWLCCMILILQPAHQLQLPKIVSSILQLYIMVILMHQQSIIKTSHLNNYILHSVPQMSTTATAVTLQSEQIQITGSILTLSIFQEKLMRNFYIINSRLKRLDQLAELDVRLKALEKENKFVSNKMEMIIERLPKDPIAAKSEAKQLVRDQIYQIFNNKQEKLMTSKYHEDLTKAIHALRLDIARIRVDGPESPSSPPRKDSLGGANTFNKASYTAAQVLLQQQQNKKAVVKESLNEVLDRNEMSVVENIIRNEEQSSGNQILAEINSKFEDVYRKLEQIKLGRTFNDYGEKQIQKFERYEQYEKKSEQTTRRIKEKQQIKLEGIKKQNVRGEMLKNDLYAEYQKAEIIRAEVAKDRRKSIGMGAQTFTNGFREQVKPDFRDLKAIDDAGTTVHPATGASGLEQKEKDRNDKNDKSVRIKPSQSVKKLERLERRLKVDDIKDLNGVLREIELRIQGRVTHEIFMGFVQDFEQKLQILRVTKDSSHEISEIRKLLYTLENRLQAVIAFLQNSANEDDALLVRKQWTCVSCDKNIEKFHGKVGQHLNWDTLASRKISPGKVGAFGQTGQLASKIRSLMDRDGDAE